MTRLPSRAESVPRDADQSFFGQVSWLTVIAVGVSCLSLGAVVVLYTSVPTREVKDLETRLARVEAKVGVANQGTSSTEGPKTTVTPEFPANNGEPAVPSLVVPWSEARMYVGQTKTVEGKIVATRKTDKACFLNFHVDYKRHFTAVIFANKFSAFPQYPETYYRDKKVRVTGEIKLYERDGESKPEIIVESPSQIKIVQ